MRPLQSGKYQGLCGGPPQENVAKFSVLKKVFTLELKDVIQITVSKLLIKIKFQKIMKIC